MTNLSTQETLKMEEQLVFDALDTIKTLFDKGVGIEKGLSNKGWNVEVSLICSNEGHSNGIKEGLNEIKLNGAKVE